MNSIALFPARVELVVPVGATGAFSGGAVACGAAVGGCTVPSESFEMAPSWLPLMSSASSSTITSLKRWFFFVSVDVFLFVACEPPVDWS